MYFALIFITVTGEQAQSTVPSQEMDANGFRDNLEFTGDYTVFTCSLCPDQFIN